MISRQKEGKSGLRVVSLFEAAKGLLVLVTGFGLLSYIHKDVHSAAEQLVRHLHLNPASGYPRIFLDLADRITDGDLWRMAAFALLYAAVRLIEAYGLWHERTWAEWLGLSTGAIYLPVELFEIIRGVTWPKAVILIVNTVVVGYLLLFLWRARQKHDQQRDG